jgi:hypothetical protein
VNGANEEAFIQKSHVFTHLFKTNKDEVPPEFHLALQIIEEEFEKAKYSIGQRQCPGKEGFGCHLVAISERYALDLGRGCGGNTPIYLFDNLYGQRR